ncbi:MAG TPA: M1 family metallopeptidase [Gemmatimonadales bacterium]|nr:M1 family metallopeptidase [Gemmatimonadales bacterium]
MRLPFAVASLVVSLALPLAAQQPPPRRVFTHADTLRGSVTPERAWWDARFYDLHVNVHPADSSVVGWNGITYQVLGPAREMQIDLQAPMVLDSAVQDGRTLTYRRDGNAWFVTLTARQKRGAEKLIRLYYHGAWRMDPADTGRRRFGGAFHWSTDSAGQPWIATAVEGPGASTWWPLKDHPADEPDSQRIAITVPDPMLDVSNGRLRSTTHHPDGTTTFEWFVADPINSYDVAVNASAAYVQVHDTLAGLNGPLTVDFWALAPHRDRAAALVPQVKTMLGCFERWFGPYPWYADGYKLIEVPYLGMEHQSGIAYGNQYLPGYRGIDLSGTGEGMGWDYIVVHESAHEWWGNSVSAKDHADMWIHESFGMYAEGLYLECTKDRAAEDQYFVGVRRMIRNDEPIIGTYGVYNVPRSQDRYPKGANMLMTMRAVVNDDARWAATLRGLQGTFGHTTVTAQDIRGYMSQHTGVDLQKIFVQYQETTDIPVFEYRTDGATLSYRWNHVVDGFAMPVRLSLGADTSWVRLSPTTAWQTTPSTMSAADSVRIDPEFYVTAHRVP